MTAIIMLHRSDIASIATLLHENLSESHVLIMIAYCDKAYSIAYDIVLQFRNVIWMRYHNAISSLAGYARFYIGLLYTI